MTQPAGTVHYQAERPSSWRLADDVELPDGRLLRGTKARVYQVLEIARRTCYVFQIGRHPAPAGWVPTWILREPWCGGSAGDKRQRELKTLGVDIESMRFQDPQTGVYTDSWLWRLATPPDPNQRNGPESSSAQVSAGASKGLAHLRFRLCDSRPACWVGELVDLSPGMVHCAAPDARLAHQVARDQVTPGGAGELYRLQLLAAYHAGELARVFAMAHCTLVCDAPFDALGVLRKALLALGAEETP